MSSAHGAKINHVVTPVHDAVDHPDSVLTTPGVLRLHCQSLMTVDMSGCGLTLQCEDGTIRFQITSLYDHKINTKECVTMTSARHSDAALVYVSVVRFLLARF